MLLKKANNCANGQSRLIVKEKEELKIYLGELQKDNDQLRGQLNNAENNINCYKNEIESLTVKEKAMEERYRELMQKESEFKVDIEKQIENVKELTCKLDREIFEKEDLISKNEVVIRQCGRVQD